MESKHIFERYRDEKKHYRFPTASFRQPIPTGYNIEASPHCRSPAANSEDRGIEEKPKKQRKKRVLTEEQKEALRRNLEKGRKTALLNRQRKAAAKKVQKEKELEEQE